MMNEISINEWSKEWPTEEGDYLIYGDFSKANDQKFHPKFELAHVRLSAMGTPIYWSLGVFFHKSEGSWLWSKKLIISGPDKSLFL
jgi:hypothetical protein